MTSIDHEKIAELRECAAGMNTMEGPEWERASVIMGEAMPILLDAMEEAQKERDQEREIIRHATIAIDRAHVARYASEGGRLLNIVDRINRLREERDQARAEVARLKLDKSKDLLRSHRARQSALQDRYISAPSECVCAECEDARSEV